MYSILVDRAVIKALEDAKSYPAKVGRQIAVVPCFRKGAVKILSLSVDPRPAGSKRIGDGYRVDSGEHRIYYEVDDGEHVVIVRLVALRNDDAVYKQLKRKTGQ